MNSPSKPRSDANPNLLVAVHERNAIVAEDRNFLRKLIFGQLAAIGVLVLVIAGLVVAYVKVEREFFATDASGRITRIYSLAEPLVSNSKVRQFALESLQAGYNIDFVHYVEQLGGLDYWYTTDGHQSFKGELDRTGFLRDLINDRLVSAATPTSAPNITREGLHQGVYKWAVEVPLLLTLSNNKEKRSQNLKLLVTLTRVSEVEKPGGIAVERVVHVVQ